MSIVDKELATIELERHRLANSQIERKLSDLARELEAHCEEMYTALGPQSWARQGYEKFKQERTR